MASKSHATMMSTIRLTNITLSHHNIKKNPLNIQYQIYYPVKKIYQIPFQQS